MPSIEDFSSDDLLDDIISAALEYEGQFREAFIGYINQAAQSAEMLDILQDIADGEIIDITPSVEEALRRINISTGNLTDILRQTMESVARTTVESVGVDMVFDMTSPTAIDYANKMAARSITNVSTAAQQSIREVLRQVLQQDMTIAQMRRFVNSRVGLLPSHIGAVQRYYRTLIDGGTPFRRAQVLADEYASRLRMYRADMITRTEIAAAQSWGQWATWQQMRDEELIPLDAFRIWMTAQDERVCDVCGPMNRQVTSLDGQWNTPNGPVTLPTDIHPNCRCAMGITFSRGRAREFLGKGPSTDYDWWIIEKHLAKHLGNEHDQKTHGRRRSSAYSVGREAPAGYRDETKPRWAEAWDYLQKEKPPWWREPELGEDGLPLPKDQYGIDYNYPNIVEVLAEVPGDGIISSIDREYRAQSKQMILRAIALGEITPAEATERYKYEAEPSGGGAEWETLPPELYHASPYVSAIQESGGLKTREETEGTGLGGGPDNTISLTTDRAVAESITRSLKEAQYAVNLSNSDALANTKRASGSYWPEVEKMAREVYGISGEPKTAEERFDLYRSYASMREVYEGVLYPLFFGVEAETVASYDPNDIGYVVVRPSVEGAQGWQVSALGEWRVPTGDALELVDTVVSKHLGNEHDQKTHGRRKTSATYTDIPELDQVIGEFLKTKGNWTTNECPIGEYIASDLAGACQSIAEQFVEFAMPKLPEGFKVYATHTNIDEMGYTPTGDPAGEIMDEDGNIVPGFYYDHTVNEVYLPGRAFPITLDFSARQYGYDTQVLVQKSD